MLMTCRHCGKRRPVEWFSYSLWEPRATPLKVSAICRECRNKWRQAKEAIWDALPWYKKIFRSKEKFIAV